MKQEVPMVFAVRRQNLVKGEFNDQVRLRRVSKHGIGFFVFSQAICECEANSAH